MTGIPARERLPAPARIDAARCSGCTQCRLVCPVRAIEQIGERCRIDAGICTRCGLCVWTCPLRCIGAAV